MRIISNGFFAVKLRIDSVFSNLTLYLVHNLRARPSKSPFENAHFGALLAEGAAWAERDVVHPSQVSLLAFEPRVDDRPTIET